MPCKDLIKLEFEKTIFSGMTSADLLKLKSQFDPFKLSTIKTSLSKLKKEKYLMIGFRTRGRKTRHTRWDGSIEYNKGRCYYKLS